MHFFRFIMKKLLTLLLFIFALASFSASAQSFNYENIAPHPRLLLKKGDVTKMRELPNKSANAKAVHERIMKVADDYLAAEPIRRELQGKRMLSVSREALKRVFYLSYAYVMTEDMRYVAAAEREMLAASAFEDWNPSHFLDVAEMTMALSIGYDWLYRRLSVRSRSIIGTAIYEKGLRASEAQSVGFWGADNNWNQVCNAGMIYGALATLERAPEYCKALIAKSVESNKKALKMYEPDGGYPEGYSYWEYGTGFQMLLAAALESALGDDAGIAAHEGFMHSANFMNHLVAPSGLVYNFGDCSAVGAKCMPVKYWFAHKKGDNAIVAIDEGRLRAGEFEEDRLLPLYMICTSAMDLSKVEMPSQKMWYSGGEVPIYIYRSGWAKEDSFLAVKGGKASTNHAHMDAGSFVYELGGVRWAIDLGAENYHKLESAGVDLWNMGQQSSRWGVYSIGVESHNTLSISGERHKVEGKAEITSHHASQREKGAEVDLSSLFTGQANRVTRSFALDKRDYLTITDHIENGAQHSTFEWRMATRANAEIVSPQLIMLTQDGKTLYLKIKTRANAVAKIWKDSGAKEYEKSTEGVVRVGFTIEVKAGDSVDVEVAMSPVKTNVISRIKQKVLR